MPKIYLIIASYNAMKWAEKCFSSLQKFSIPVNVIVVDSGSGNGTQHTVPQLFMPIYFTH